MGSAEFSDTTVGPLIAPYAILRTLTLEDDAKASCAFSECLLTAF